MQVNLNTKIGTILKEHPAALDTITALSPKFEKLKNPLLRKLMAGRVSIAMAAKIGGVKEADFFQALQPLGFTIKEKEPEHNSTATEAPAFLKAVKPAQIVEMDVRPLLEAGNDPLKQILAKVKAMKQGEVLKIINTFEPTPLIPMLKKKGFHSWTATISSKHIECWFYRESGEPLAELPDTTHNDKDWEQLRKRFAGKMENLDVRELEMPQPMMQILEALETLPENKALYVLHKRVPVFLLPELAQRNFEIRSQQISDNEVHLLIFGN